MSEELRIIILKMCELSNEMSNIKSQSNKYKILQAKRDVLEEVINRIAKENDNE